MLEIGRNKLATTFVVGTLLWLAFGCAYINPSASAGGSYSTAGSDWNWALSENNSFMATETTTNSTITGTFQRDPLSGFLKGFVTGVTGSANPALIGTNLGAIEIPGYLFLTAPVLTTETQLLAGTGAGTCPSSDYTANYIYLQFKGSDDLSNAARDYYGQYNFTATNGNIVTSHQYNMSNSTVTTPATFTGSCVAGTYKNSATGYKAYLSGNAAVVKLLSPNTLAGDAIIGVPQATLGSMSAIYGNYNGLLYNASDSVPVRYVQTTSSISGSTIALNSVLTMDFMTNDNGQTANLVLGAVDSPLPGMMTGTIQIGTSATSHVACTAATNVNNSGKNVILCVGQNPNMTSAAVNVVLVSH